MGLLSGYAVDQVEPISQAAPPCSNSSPAPALASVVPAPPVARPMTALFVATDLRWWGTDEPKLFAADTELDGVMYRRLDPAYYAWLWSRVQLVIAAYDARRIGRPGFDGVIARWSAIYKWAVDHWGADALSAAESPHNPRLYSPPRAALKIR